MVVGQESFRVSDGDSEIVAARALLGCLDLKGLLVTAGAVAEVVGIEVGVVSGVFNPEDSGVGAPDWRPRHDERYHTVGSRSA
jgi:hypothetical protein